jgi:hypothetical protein
VAKQLVENFDILVCMGTTESARIIAVDRLHNGLCIYFADGRSAFYSGGMLHSLLDLAEAISKESPLEE